MLAVIKHTLIESIHKRMALALMVISLLMFAFTLYFFSFQTQPDGRVLVFARGAKFSQPADTLVRALLESTLTTTAGVWTFLGIFALAPLLSSYLEKGFAGSLFTKPLARWQIFIGRTVGAFALFVLSVALLDGLPAAYFWIRTGISPKHFLVAVGISLVSFLSLVAIMALVAIQRNGPAPAIIVAFIQVTVASVLAQRAMIYKMFPAKWLQQGMDLFYYILPKNSDLAAAAQKYLTSGQITNWMPLWSTALFTAAILGFAIWQLQRKSL
jgi:ABC-type transport system involved in multi-copper enzyme maturation permease subunit